MADNRGNFRGSLQNQNLGASARSGVVKGTSDFVALSKALKNAGQKGLRNELNKVMRNAAKPLIPKVRAAAEAKLPKGGGLNERIAKKPYRAQTRTGTNTAGVRIVGSKVDPRINNNGRVHHPVFGRKPGVVQVVPQAKGYFDETLAKEAPAIRAEVANAFNEFVDRLAREL